MIFHIPHNSTSIPEKVRNQFVLSDIELEKELLIMTDHMTSELFKSAMIKGDNVVEYPVSRLVLDPERYEDDDKEIMNKVGMGVIYRKTSDGGILRKRLSNEEKSDLIGNYYLPHHAKLNYFTKKSLDKQSGVVQLIDCHSFSSKPLKYEDNPDSIRPDFCLGTNHQIKDKPIMKILKNYIEGEGYSFDINNPFSGSILPNNYFNEDRVQSIMIEVNRKLYMNEKTGKKIQSFLKTKKIIKEIINLIRTENLN